MATGFETFTGTAVKQSVSPKATNISNNNNNNNKIKTYSIVNNKIVESGYTEPSNKSKSIFTPPDSSKATTKVNVGIATAPTNTFITPKDVSKIIDDIVPNFTESLDLGSNQRVLEITKEGTELITNTYTTKEYIEKITPVLPETTGIFEQIKTIGKFALIGLGGLIIFNLTRRSS